MSNQPPRRPEKEYRCGPVVGAIWRHESTKNGRTFHSRDKAGSLGGVEEAVFSVGKDARKPAKLKLETVAQDFSTVGLAAREVFAELAIGGHTVHDERTWGPKQKALVAGK